MIKTGKSPCGAALIVLLTIAVYIPAFRCGFIWDDDDHFTKNPAMLSVEGLKRIWSSLAVSRYYPLTLTTFWVERRLWGLHPLPYHAVNIALQAANAVLLWTLLRRLRVPGAWLAAALWAVHPVGVESVAWVTELKNIQSGFFFFLSMLCFLRFEADNKRGSYALALAFGAAAMLSKPSTVVLPLVLLLCTWWERGRWRRGSLLRIAPFFGLAVGMSLLTIIEQRGHVMRAGIAQWQLGPGDRLAVAGRAIWFYAGKVLWPAGLTFVYPRWDVGALSWSSWAAWVGLVAVSVTLWKFRRRVWCRPVLFGGGFFLAALLPVLGFFDVFYFRYSFVADHFQYLASIGIIALAAGGGTVLCERTGSVARYAGAMVAAIVLLALGVSTWKRTYVYQNLETLWQDTVTRNPGAYMAHNNLGVALSLAGKAQEAIGQFEKAARLKPDDAEAYGNLGNVSLHAGKLQEAIGQYEHALQLNPNFAVAHTGLGLALERTGKIPEAAWHYEEALRVKPDDAEAYNYLGLALKRMGRVPEAAGQYEQALRIDPDYLEALNNLAWLLATQAPAEGADPVRAVALAERACKLTDNRVATYLDTLAAAYAAAGRFGDAVGTAEKAIPLADSAAQTQLVSRIEMRLELYRANRAYYEPKNVTDSRNP
ncbi:MAG: tetratricopeptide repeat protein [Verrucomicrobiia bacterium]|jgi:tetratricopeptide (TPR) repeat protein